MVRPREGTIHGPGKKNVVKVGMVEGRERG